MSMYPQKSAPIEVISEGSTMPDIQENDQPHDEVEMQVQQILADLEAAPQEVQLAVCARLLTAIGSKLTAATATKAVSAARVDPRAGTQKAPSGRSRGASKKKTAELGRIESRLSQLPDPSDPIAAWHVFGGNAEAVQAELRQEPLGVLQAMLRHDHMPAGPAPRGKSSASLADAIVQRLERHFNV